jgi:hypothetical protein
VRQISPLAAFRHVIQSTIHNMPFAFHVSWPWLILMAPLNILLNIYGLANLPETGTPDEATQIKIGLLSLGIGLFTLFASASIAVNWHRYILLDEVPQGWARLRTDNTVWRYFGNTLLIALRVAFTAIPAYLLGGLLAWALGKVGVILLVFIIVAVLVWTVVTSYRLSIKLPAIALQRTDFTMANALEVSQGNFWQILGLAILFLVAAIGIFVLIMLLSLVQQKTGSEVFMALVFGVQVVANWIVTIMGVTLFTSLYGYFVEKREF